MSKLSGRIVWELHDEPHLEGQRITVQFIKTQVEDHKHLTTDPDDVRD